MGKTFLSYVRSTRISLVREGKGPHVRVTGPTEVFKFFKPLSKESREVTYVACLDAHGNIVGVDLASAGTIDHTLVAPREIFRLAILKNAQRIVMVHNHPSGNAFPSENDKAAAMRIKEAGEVIGVMLQDSIIIAADGSFYSMEQNGLV